MKNVRFWLMLQQKHLLQIWVLCIFVRTHTHTYTHRYRHTHRHRRTDRHTGTDRQTRPCWGLLECTGSVGVRVNSLSLAKSWVSTTNTSKHTHSGCASLRRDEEWSWHECKQRYRPAFGLGWKVQAGVCQWKREEHGASGEGQRKCEWVCQNGRAQQMCSQLELWERPGGSYQWR